MMLADEINRATPKAQSALLEAMEERQISAEGRTCAAARAVLRDRHPEPGRPDRHLPAARKPARPLSDAHLPRLSGSGRRARLAGRRRPSRNAGPPAPRPRCLASSTPCWPQPAPIHVGPRLLDYVQALLARSREGAGFSTGLSPRAGLALLAAARAWALLAGRDHVLPEDVQAVLPAVAGHRLRPADETPLPPERTDPPPARGGAAALMGLAGIRSRLQRWLFRVSGPEPAPIRLGQRRIFVLPTGFGLALGLTLLVMLLASINYTLSLGFALTFLIGSVAWISIHHAFRNLVG
jgi:hypothetical protein